MKTKRKGYKAVNKYIEDFLNEGNYIVDKVEKTGKFVKQKDLFGLFDLVAIEDTGAMELIQITCNKPHPHKKYLEFEKKWGKNCRVIQAVWYDRRGWKLFNYNNGHKLISDEMKKK